ncbi:MAG: putative DNA binding domain-containing protein, partial [Bacteroidales bacterium]|nr:putative DNA binding domain-containing protein [Bacteroidales bacterium]
VETVDATHHQIAGQIRYASNVFPPSSVPNHTRAYKASHVGQYLPEGCIFDAELVGSNRYGFEFSLEKPFLDALLRAIVVNKEVLAVLQKVNQRGLMTWWTADGYPAYVESEGCSQQFDVGQTAQLYILGREDNNGYVYARVVGPSDGAVDEDESRRFCVEHLLYGDDFAPDTPAQWATIDTRLVQGLSRLLLRYQRSLVQASERFRVLCVCRILAAMTTDTVAADYIAVACDYLRNLMLFSSGHIDKIKPLEPDANLAAEPGIARRMGIVRILQDYGLDADSEHLSTIIHTSRDPLLVQLAKLVQSCNRIDDVYPTIKTVIKREITKFLAVETEDSTDFEEAVGPNLGMESSRVEFKTSFFFAPPDAYEQNQEKNIFRSLCSFLNAPEGGTLYLGVNDSGGINGLHSELEALGKRAPGYSGIDGYIRYITDRARSYFDLDVRLCLHIEPAYDNRVVAIHVEPYEHGVVEFEGTPYIRNNIESVKMSQTLRRQIEAKRIEARRGKPSKNIVALTEAIREERQVILHGCSELGYSQLEPLTAEPFAFTDNRDFVWAYNVAEARNMVLRIQHIGNVQITSDRWAHKAQHQSEPMDIFHCTGANPIKMRLELDIVARNILIEEYPEATSELEDLGNNRYMLSTSVFDLQGVGRFYCGLADHIRIAHAPGLAEFAKEHFQRGLKVLQHQPMVNS